MEALAVGSLASMSGVSPPRSDPDPDPGAALAVRRTVRTGWLLLAFSLPFGLTLETLHAWKAPLYVGSEMRREMWRLAHAHGTLLGVVCLVWAALAENHVAPRIRAAVARQVRWGAVLMPLGFFAGASSTARAILRWGCCWRRWARCC